MNTQPIGKIAVEIMALCANDAQVSLKQKLESLSQSEKDSLGSHLIMDAPLALYIHKNMACSTECLKLLIDNVPGVYIEDANGHNLMSHLINQDNPQALRYILGRYPQMCNYIGIHRLSLIDWAFIWGRQECLDVLLSFNPRESCFNHFTLSKESIFFTAMQVDAESDVVRQMGAKIFDYLNSILARQKFEQSIKSAAQKADSSKKTLS